MNLDAKDRLIISMFSKDPDISQEEVGRALGISQPSVAVRIRKLKTMGALHTQTGINPIKMGLHMAKVDISTNDTNELLDMFQGCPYFMNGYIVSGRHNLCLFFLSENISTLESIINGHIRPNPNVREVDFNIIINSAKPVVTPVELTPTKSEQPPCGVLHECGECEAFETKRCMGCPVTGHYQGWFF